MSHLNEIVPGLYIGDWVASFDYNRLKKDGITHIINLSGLPNGFPRDFKYLKIDISDAPYVNIGDYFEETYEFIENGLKNGKVLVHCFAGMSRSVSIVIAYLMRKYNQSFEKTLALVKSRRPIANPNSGFKQQLKSYEQTLVSRSSSRSVETSLNSNNPHQIITANNSYYSTNRHGTPIYRKFSSKRYTPLTTKSENTYKINNNLTTLSTKFNNNLPRQKSSGKGNFQLLSMNNGI